MHALISKLILWILIAPSQQGFFSSFVSDLKNYIGRGDYWGLLSDPRYAIIMGIIFVVAILLKTKAVPLLIFAVYGYTLTFHLSSMLKTGGNIGEDFVGNLDSVLVFIAGFLITTGVIIYFWLIKGD